MVKLKSFKRAPFFVAVGIIVFVCCIRFLRLDFFERLEWMAYDMRARIALHFPAVAATNIAFVAIDDSSISAVQSGQFGYSYGLYWPRQVYGRLVQELAAEGAKITAFDVMFRELRPDHPPVQMEDGGLIDSDEFLALQMRLASNVIVAGTADALLPDLFTTNALGLGDISTEKDSDGVLRRVRAFRVYRHWHPFFIQVAANPDYGVDLEKARVEPGHIILPQAGTTNVITVPVDARAISNSLILSATNCRRVLRPRPKLLPMSASGRWASELPHRS